MSLRVYGVACFKAAMVCAAVLGLMSLAPHAAAADKTFSYNIAGRANVRVDTNDGSVRISTSDTKTVQFRVEYEGYELDKNLHIESSQSGDSVQLTARTTGHWGFSWGGHGRRLHIDVQMPRQGDLDAHTGDGSVEAASIEGNVKVYTGDGSIRANTLSGNIDLHTNDGSINVDTLKGTLRLHTGDGSIEARDLDGRLDADSGDGHVRIAGRFDGLNVRTGDGSVDARVQSGSKMSASWNVRTGDGSVDLALPSDFQANIDASTGDGHISLALPLTIEGTYKNSEIHGKLNGGGQPLTIHTGDGSIRLNKA